VAGYQVVRAAEHEVIVQPTRTLTRTAECPLGKKVVGGGGQAEYVVSGGVVAGLADVIASYPSTDPNTYWAVEFGRQDNLDLAVNDALFWNVYAICANTTP
jgi:hypothetical protein